MDNLMNVVRVLVLDGEQCSSLAVVRSLGRQEVPVIVGSIYASSLAGKSRYCERVVQYRDPLTDQTGFLKDIRETVEQYKADIVIPCTDLSSTVLLMKPDLFSPEVIIMGPDYEQYHTASDKILLLEMARKLGVPCPESKVVHGVDEWRSLARNLEYPVIFKPRASILNIGGKLCSTAVHVVFDYMEGETLINSAPEFSVPFLVQQRISGEGAGVFALFDKGRPIVFFSHRRLREKPPWGGVSVFCESVEPDPQAREFASRLLEKLCFHGVAMVEFKRDYITGIFYLMEVNARFWGSLQLAVDSGVNFPFLFYQLTRGKHIKAFSAFSQARLRWLLGDWGSLLMGLRRRKNEAKDLQQGRCMLIAEFVATFFRKTNYQILRKDDPAPFFSELRQSIRNKISHGLFSVF